MTNLEGFSQLIRDAHSRSRHLFEQQHTSEPSQDLLDTALEELQSTLEELQTADEELQVQQAALETAYEKAADQQSQYREYFELAPESYLVTDGYGVIHEANLRAAELLNRHQGFIVGVPMLVFIASEARSTFMLELENLRRGVQHISWETSLIPTSKNTPIDVSISVQGIQNHEGKVTRLQWIIQRKATPQESQQSVQQQYESLRQELQERTHELLQVWRALIKEIIERQRIQKERDELLATKHDRDSDHDFPSNTSSLN